MKVVIMLEMLLSIWFCSRAPLLSLWFVFHWSLWFLFRYGNVTVFKETIDTYPDRKRIEPRYFGVIWKPLISGSHKRIPREMYYADLFVCAVFLCYTLSLLFFGDSEMILPIAKLCIWSYISSLIVSRLLIAYQAHISRYKCLSLRNLRYLFDPYDESVPIAVGQCDIVGVSRKGEKYIASVFTNGRLYERVIIEKHAYCGENERYMLYELHGVYYAE